MPALALPKLVCLPGLDGSGTFFTDLLSALEGAAEAQVMTYPAHGPQTYEALADHLIGQLPDGEYVILGESFSGPLAIWLADRAHRKPRGLILAATFARNPFPVLGGLLASTLPALINQQALPVMESVLLRPGDHATTWRVFQAISSLPPDVLKSRVKAVLSCDVQKPLARLDMPILYLQGSEDKLISAAHGALMARTAKNLRITRVPAPHFVLQYETHEIAREHLLPFLNSLK